MARVPVLINRQGGAVAADRQIPAKAEAALGAASIEAEIERVDRDLQRMRLGRSRRLAMILASLRTLARFNHRRLKLTINDQQAVLDTPLLFVGNNEYRIDLGAPGRRERLDGGELCVMVMHKK